MDAKSFRRLFASFGSLTGPQLKELWTALRSLRQTSSAIPLTPRYIAIAEFLGSHRIARPDPVDTME